MMLLLYILAILIALLISFLPGIHINLVYSIFSKYIYEKSFFLFLLGLYLPLSVIPLLLFNVSEENIASAPYFQRIKNKSKLFSFYVASVLLSAFISLFFPNTLFNVVWKIKPYMPYIITFISIIMVVKSKHKFYFIIFFLLSSLLGFHVLNSPLKDKFLPMFTGFFAVPFLLFSISSKRQILFVDIDPSFILPTLVGVVFGFIALLLPGVSSPSVVSLLINPFFPSVQYVSLLSSITTTQYMLSIPNYLVTHTKRVGIIDYLSNFQLNYSDNIIIFIGIIVGVILVLLLVNRLPFIKNYKVLLLYILFIVFLIDGLYGLFIFLLSALLGILCRKYSVSPMALLGSIISYTFFIYLIKPV